MANRAPAPVARIPTNRSTKTYYGGPHKVAKHLSLKQGFQPLSYENERRLVGKEWMKLSTFTPLISPQHMPIHPTVNKKKVKTRAVLSNAARSSIKAGLSNGTFNPNNDAREPPQMNPSEDPREYSKVRCASTYTQQAMLTDRSGAPSAGTLAIFSCCVQGVESASVAMGQIPPMDVLSGTQLLTSTTSSSTVRGVSRFKGDQPL